MAIMSFGSVPAAPSPAETYWGENCQPGQFGTGHDTQRGGFCLDCWDKLLRIEECLLKVRNIWRHHMSSLYVLSDLKRSFIVGLELMKRVVALSVLSHLKIRLKRWLLRSASLAVTVPLSRNWNTNHGRWRVHLHALSPHVSVRKFQTIQLKYQRITEKWGPHEQSLSQTIGCGLSKCPDASSETSGLACSWHLQTAHRSWNAIVAGNSTTDGWIFGASPMRGASGSKNRFSEHHCHLSRINQALTTFLRAGFFHVHFVE